MPTNLFFHNTLNQKLFFQIDTMSTVGNHYSLDLPRCVGYVGLYNFPKHIFTSIFLKLCVLLIVETFPIIYFYYCGTMFQIFCVNQVCSYGFKMFA